MSAETYKKVWKPWVYTAVKEAYAKFSRTSVGTYPGHDPNQSLACDFMIPAWQTDAGRKYGQQLADWLWSNRVRLGIWYIIFNGKIISQTRPGAGWIHYFNAGSSDPSKSHKNHVHVSFYNKKPPAPKPAPKPAAPKKFSVKKGQTLSGLAKSSGVKLTALVAAAAALGIAADRIPVGLGFTCTTGSKCVAVKPAAPKPSAPTPPATPTPTPATAATPSPAPTTAAPPAPTATPSPSPTPSSTTFTCPSGCTVTVTGLK